MIGAKPQIGYVLRYEYLWTSDPRANQEDLGSKERPAVVVVAVRRDAGRTLVRVVPVTHHPPRQNTPAVEIPAETKRRLGLDSDRSWIILDHANEFVWPGPDLRPVPGREPLTIYYGPLPPKLYRTIRERLLQLLRERGIPAVLRKG